MPINSPIEQHYSDEMQEIIGAVPRWLIRWGIALFFMVLVVIVAFSAIIKSPDIVMASLRIDSENRPQQILARREGKLVEIFVQADQVVGEKMVLGYIESRADHERVLALSSYIDTLFKRVLSRDYTPIKGINLDTQSHYGELQPAFQEFYISVLQYMAYAPGGMYSEREKMIKRELSDLELMNQQLLQEQQIHQQAYGIAEINYKSQKELAASKVISSFELRQEELKFLNTKIPLQNTKAALINNSMSRTAKSSELMDLAHELQEQKSVFLSKVQGFKSEIDNWKKEYLLISENGGKVVFQQLLKKNQWLDKNEPVMFITNLQGSGAFGELSLTQRSYGKIKVGQEVLIKLSAFPSQEFGLLKGRVSYISNILRGDSVYTAKVKLSQRTTYNKLISLQIGLVAQAEIITDEQSLFGRVFQNITGILKNR